MRAGWKLRDPYIVGDFFVEAPGLGGATIVNVVTDRLGAALGIVLLNHETFSLQKPLHKHSLQGQGRCGQS